MTFGRRRILRRVLGNSRIAALGALHSSRRNTRATRAGASAIVATGLIIAIIVIVAVTLLIVAAITK